MYQINSMYKTRFTNKLPDTIQYLKVSGCSTRGEFQCENKTMYSKTLIYKTLTYKDSKIWVEKNIGQNSKRERPLLWCYESLVCIIEAYFRLI